LSIFVFSGLHDAYALDVDATHVYGSQSDLSIDVQKTISEEVRNLSEYRQYLESKKASEREFEFQLAQANGKNSGSVDAVLSGECKAFREDPDADIGDIMRAGCQPTLGQMSALMDNPLGNVAMVINQFDFYNMENEGNGDRAEQYNLMQIYQFPKGINENWNLINRIVLNWPSAPLDQDKIDTFNYSTLGGGAAGGSPPTGLDLFNGRTMGFGDMYYVGLFSPKDPITYDNLKGKSVWGAGFDLGFPTASKDLLGSGRWTGGPTAIITYMGPKWKVGALMQQYWDLGGAADRDKVNLSNLQYFIYYTLNETTSIGAGPNIIANWEQSDHDDRFTVPVGIGINKTVNFGKLPVRFGIEVHYSVIRPENVPGSEYDIRFYAIPAIPSALFKWME